MSKQLFRKRFRKQDTLIVNEAISARHLESGRVDPRALNLWHP